MHVCCMKGVVVIVWGAMQSGGTKLWTSTQYEFLRCLQYAVNISHTTPTVKQLIASVPYKSKM